MRLIYHNFDGLDVSFQGAFAEEILNALAEAKEQAKTAQEEKAVISLGAKNMPVSVAATGARGGYAYRFDTGPDGAIWFVKHSTNRQAWNIRVSVKSLSLALNGYEKTRDNLFELLNNFGVCGCWYSLEGELLPPDQSVGRIDYCFDFIADDFEPSPENIVTHSRSTVRGIEPLEVDTVWRANRLETLTIGKMPNRQVTIYDKTKEIINSNKPYWWDLWKIDKATFVGKIWRVEVRAGKNELKQWNIGPYFALEFCMGNIIQRILSDIRYVVPSDDTNRSRWPLHPIWSACQETAQQALAPYISNAERKKIIKDLRENLIARAQKNFRGAVATYNHLLGHRPDDVMKTLDTIAEDVQAYSENQKTDFQRKLRKAEDKYVFLGEKRTKNE